MSMLVSLDKIVNQMSNVKVWMPLYSLVIITSLSYMSNKATDSIICLKARVSGSEGQGLKPR